MLQILFDTTFVCIFKVGIWAKSSNYIAFRGRFRSLLEIKSILMSLLRLQFREIGKVRFELFKVSLTPRSPPSISRRASWKSQVILFAKNDEKKSQHPKIFKNFPPSLSVEKERKHSHRFIALRTARCQFWKVYLEIRENLLLRNKLSLFSFLLWCSPFEAETRSDWWRIASARRSFFLFGTFAQLKSLFHFLFERDS